ncbi:hypothetical protein KR032_007209 [Drosophila birchii]|nr:hypothetical protein KR032_007209 [Drosophila birchii]
MVQTSWEEEQDEEEGDEGKESKAHGKSIEMQTWPVGCLPVSGCCRIAGWLYGWMEGRRAPPLFVCRGGAAFAITQSRSFVAHQLPGRHVFSFGASRQVLGGIVTSQEVAGDVIDS